MKHLAVVLTVESFMWTQWNITELYNKQPLHILHLKVSIKSASQWLPQQPQKHDVLVLISLWIVKRL